MMKKVLLTLAGCMLASGAFAQPPAFQMSLIPEIALHSPSTHIKGVTLSLWGENPQTAIALGVVNGSSGDSSGVSLGFLANYAESYEGAHLAWVANYASRQFTGLQLAAFNYAQRLHGLQLGFINFAGAADQGLQVGFVNIMNNTQQWFTDFPDEIAPVMPLVNWRF